MLTCRRFTFVLALGSFMLATLVWLGAPPQSAQAEEDGLADLIIHKICLAAEDDGSAAFIVEVNGPDEFTASQPVDCGDVIVMADLQPGVYGIEELIAGPNADHYLTAIICDGDTVVGLALEIVIGDQDRGCLVVNLFVPPIVPAFVMDVTGANSTPPGGSTTFIDGGSSININNSSINNVSDDGLDNANIEENDNINDNVQRQTVTRSQTNSSD